MSDGESDSSCQGDDSGYDSQDTLLRNAAPRLKEEGTKRTVPERKRNLPSKLKSPMVLIRKRKIGTAKSQPQTCRNHKDTKLWGTQMKCLTPGSTSFQESDLINAYAIHMSTPIGPDRLLYNTFRTEWLTKEERIRELPVRSPSPEKLSAIKGTVKEYFDYDMVLFPVNVHGAHWILVAMDKRRKEFQVLDSLWTLHMYKDKIKRLIDAIGTEVDIARKYLDLVLPYVKSWDIREIENVPKQTDGHSCGLFVLKYMEHWDGTRLKVDFSQKDVDISNKKMAAELIFSHANQNEKVKEKVHEIMRKRDIPN